MAQKRNVHIAETQQKIIEPELCYFRQGYSGHPAEIVISLDGKTEHVVYGIRASLLGGMVRDVPNLFVRSIAPTAWEKMWSRKFDYPERL